MHITASPPRGFSKFSPSSENRNADYSSRAERPANQACFCPPAACTTRSACATRSSLGNTVTLRSSRTPSGCIEQCPSNSAPSCTDSTGAAILPLTLADGRISIRCVALISPLTLPATDTDAARICAVITADSPIVRLSLALISPSTSPSMRAGPSNEILPEIFEPRSRYARPSAGAGPLARGADGEVDDEDVDDAGAGEV